MSAKKNKTGSKNRSSTKKKTRYFYLVKAGFYFLLVVGFAFVFFVFLVWAGFFGALPSEESLSHIRQNTASEVYTADGKLMGRYYIVNRLTIGNENISPHIIHALIATEDARFFKHHGIDFISLGRVVVKSLLLGNRAQGGGSTISEQLARNIFPRKGHSWGILLISKAKEAIIADRLEKVYDKEHILTLYLNTVPFGEDVYGIETASQRFFSKPAGSLNPVEAATLIGMLAANTAYNPRMHPVRAKKRRDIVLRRMEEHHFLTPGELKKWQSQPLELHYRKIDQNTGIAPYFRDYIQEKVEKILKTNDDDTIHLLSDGLKISTTIQSGLQRSADQAVARQMKKLQGEFDLQWQGHCPFQDTSALFLSAVRKSTRYRYLKQKGYNEVQIIDSLKIRTILYGQDSRGRKKYISPLDSIRRSLMTLHAGFLVMDPFTGYVLAWVGGIDHSRYQYDHVTAKRQTGSTFKPFVYAAALEEGMSPCDFISNERRVFPKFNDWSPENAEGEYDGYYSLKGALAHSVNTVTAEVMIKTGVEHVVKMARRLGIQSDIPEVPSIALGTVSVSLLELTRAYAPFVNGGARIEPVTILKITDRKGKVLYDYSPATKKQVLDRDVSLTMLYMLKEVVDSGTARALHSVYHLQNALAGKTGTTQHNADGWFIGITPGLVTGCWVGAESPAIHFRTTDLGQGAHTALPVFAGFTRRLNADAHLRRYARGSFPVLSYGRKERLDCPDYVLKKPRPELFEWLFGRKHTHDSLRLLRQKQRRERQQKTREKIRETMRRIFGRKKK